MESRPITPTVETADSRNSFCYSFIRSLSQRSFCRTQTSSEITLFMSDRLGWRSVQFFCQSSPSQEENSLCLFFCCPMSSRTAQPVNWLATIGFRFSIGCLGFSVSYHVYSCCGALLVSLQRAKAYPSVTLMRGVVPLSPYSSCRDAWQQW